MPSPWDNFSNHRSVSVHAYMLPVNSSLALMAYSLAKPAGIAGSSAGLLPGPGCVANTVTDSAPDGAAVVLRRQVMAMLGSHWL
jgi:hypothetical protein